MWPDSIRPMGDRKMIAAPGRFCYDPDQAGIAQLVERNLAKVEVASSSLVSRSTSSLRNFSSQVIQARWQSGHAAACKAVNAGSIPTLASKNFPAREVQSRCPGGEIGRRKGLKILWPETAMPVRVRPWALYKNQSVTPRF